MPIELEPLIAGPDGKPRQRKVRAASGKAKEEGNGLAEAAQGRRFELIPFDKIAFDTTPAYFVKGIVPRVGLCVFWGPPKCGKSFLVFDMLMHVALIAMFAKAQSSIAPLRVARRSKIASKPSAWRG